MTARDLSGHFGTAHQRIGDQRTLHPAHRGVPLACRACMLAFAQAPEHNRVEEDHGQAGQEEGEQGGADHEQRVGEGTLVLALNVVGACVRAI